MSNSPLKRKDTVLAWRMVFVQRGHPWTKRRVEKATKPLSPPNCFFLDESVHLPRKTLRNTDLDFIQITKYAQHDVLPDKHATVARYPPVGVMIRMMKVAVPRLFQRAFRPPFRSIFKRLLIKPGSTGPAICAGGASSEVQADYSAVLPVHPSYCIFRLFQGLDYRREPE